MNCLTHYAELSDMQQRCFVVYDYRVKSMCVLCCIGDPVGCCLEVAISYYFTCKSVCRLIECGTCFVVVRSMSRRIQS